MQRAPVQILTMVRGFCVFKSWYVYILLKHEQCAKNICQCIVFWYPLSEFPSKIYELYKKHWLTPVIFRLQRAHVAEEALVQNLQQLERRRVHLDPRTSRHQQGYVDNGRVVVARVLAESWRRQNVVVIRSCSMNYVTIAWFDVSSENMNKIEPLTHSLRQTTHSNNKTLNSLSSLKLLNSFTHSLNSFKSLNSVNSQSTQIIHSLTEPLIHSQM